MGKELALYYNPKQDAKARKVKGVLVRLGIRIKNISMEQSKEQVGKLAGLIKDEEAAPPATADLQSKETQVADILEEVLVLCNFTNASLDRLLRELRKSNATVALKAILTETNTSWSFFELYEEIKKEHEAMKKEK